YAKDYFFVLEKFEQHAGKPSPYLLYTVVRAKSFLRKIFDDNYDIKSLAHDYKVENAHIESEAKLKLQLIPFHIDVQRDYDNSQTHHICEYTY
ncbi:arginine--tRNA ligase, partial [Francisella tularensis]|nr:arginine--tRNA ligase [Francisella tularensis]